MANVYKNIAGSMYKLTVNDDYAPAYIKTSDGSEILKTLCPVNSSITTNIKTTDGTTAIRVYDLSDHYFDVNSTNAAIITDSTSPIVNSIQYLNGSYTINVSDSQSGIWKITNSTGDTVYADYSE